MRKQYLLPIVFILFLCGLLQAQPAAQEPAGKKMLILGIDGFDPTILDYLLYHDRLPNIKRLIRFGTYKPLKTSCPPQSPVAWSNFIVGGNPGQHGIFDFIHRDPKSIMPFLSTSKTYEPEKFLRLGKYRVPLDEGGVTLFRKGEPFWRALEKNGVFCTIFKIPSNFPPVEMTNGVAISGMGTPDLLGTYGTFYLFTDAPQEIDEDLSGGKVFPVQVRNYAVTTEIEGPPNTFIEEERNGKPFHPTASIPLEVLIDPDQELVEIKVQDHDILLPKGEFSDWVRLEFEVLPYMHSLSAIVKFYLIDAHPDLKLYMTPLNIDPANPALPMSSPPEYAKQLYEQVGPFYTQNMPEDTKAYSNGVFSTEDYIKQAQMVFDERKRLFRHFLANHNQGMLFFYFSSLDQNTHMLWQLTDPAHPARMAEDAKKYGFYLDKKTDADLPYFLKQDKEIEFKGHPYLFNLYEQMDKEIGYAMSQIDKDTTLLIVSDHGFAPYYRSFNLNTYLLEHGYITLKDPSKQGQAPFFRNVDWSRTKAYAIGLNGLYINTEGREEAGIVPRGPERDALIHELKNLLESVKDPQTGQIIISNLYVTDEVYSGDYKSLAPDIIVGYNKGYRASWQTALGKIPDHLLEDNKDAWSGDHCMDPAFLSGVFLCNKKVNLSEYSLSSMSDFILSEFGISR